MGSSINTIALALSQAQAEVGELGTEHPCNFPSQINCGHEEEGKLLWSTLDANHVPPGGWWARSNEMDDWHDTETFLGKTLHDMSAI